MPDRPNTMKGIFQCVAPRMAAPRLGPMMAPMPKVKFNELAATARCWKK